MGQSVKVAIGLAGAIMLVLAVLTHYFAGSLLRPFSHDPRVIAFGSEYLRIAAFNFVFAGIVFSSSNVFQGLGHTIPPLLSSLLRVLLFALPAILPSWQPGFALRYLGPEVLKIEEIEVPAPKKREVRIAPKALGFNRAEAMFRAGQVPREQRADRQDRRHRLAPNEHARCALPADR